MCSHDFEWLLETIKKNWPWNLVIMQCEIWFNLQDRNWLISCWEELVTWNEIIFCILVIA